MKAMLLRGPNMPFELADLPDPTPEPGEAVARVRALLRRAAQSTTNVLCVQDLVLDAQKHSVMRNGVEINLKEREFKLLEFFMRHPDEVFDVDALLSRVWHSESDSSPEALRTAVTRLRKTLGADAQNPIIVNLHGIGYKLPSKS